MSTCHVCIDLFYHHHARKIKFVDMQLFFISTCRIINMMIWNIIKSICKMLKLTCHLGCFFFLDALRADIATSILFISLIFKANVFKNRVYFGVKKCHYYKQKILIVSCSPTVGLLIFHCSTFTFKELDQRPEFSSRDKLENKSKFSIQTKIFSYFNYLRQFKYLEGGKQ